ncbi:hypothetical protein [Clostridium perfringens]|uniref:hypothetical protein n=1 Tax=Clostridium perfringens TaxID=1502 RepID=UPI0013E37A3B|nr:hypothetical protein [Clostridium perfringens]NGT67939.1 hypothetical protein [Clostridium perfringens]
MENIKKIFPKIKFLFKKYSSRGAISIGLGGLISLYIIEYCRINLIPFFNGKNSLYNFILDNNITSINEIEIFIMLVSIIAIISAPLLAKRNSKKMFEIFLIVILLFLELVCFMSLIVYQYITTLFILGTVITWSYLVWFSIDILKEIYLWTRINKSKEDQVDVTKLTFIWAIIVFILGLLR